MAGLFGLFGRGKSTATQQTAAAGLQVQTSVSGKPIPIVYGMTRVAPNLIWYGNFTATQQSAGGAGKGGITGAGGKGGGSGEYTYSCSFAAGLCEGQVDAVWNVYADKSITTLAAQGLSFFTGAYGQTPWSYLLENEQQIDNERHTVPGSPYQVTTNQSLLYDLGVIVTTSTAFTPAPPASGIGATQYFAEIYSTSVTYLFNASNIGSTVQINYTLHGVPASYTGTITSSGTYGAAVIPGVSGSGFVGGAVNVITGSPLTKVSGSPASGQYAESGGVYTFNSAQSSHVVLISYAPNNGQSQALGYSGISYVAAANFALGNNPSLPNFNYEVQGLFSGNFPQQVQGEQYTLPGSGVLTITVRFYQYFESDAGVTDQNGNIYTKVSGSPGTNQYTVSGGVYTFGGGNAGQIVNISYNASIGPDTDPSTVIDDLLTNAHYGVGFPSARLGNLSVYQAYCLATGLVISPCYDTQQQASSMLDDITTVTNSAFVWSSGLLTIVPYGDQSITANGYTYTAPSAPLYNLTDNDFLPNTNNTASSAAVMNQDPVLLTRTRPSDAYNSITLEFLDRGNNYSPAIVQAKNQASIDLYGLRQDASRSYHMLCNGNAARISVQLQLQRQEIRNIYQFTLDQRYVLLDPMDIVTLTDSNLGLNQQWVRIREITENDDGSLSFVAEEYLQGTGTAPLYSFQQAQGFNADYNASPGNTNVPVVFEPTAELAEALAVWVAASGGAMWGGCQVWISTDNETYQQVGKITGGTRQGYVDAALPAVTVNTSGLTIDQVNAASVDVSLSGGQLLNASQADANNLATLCYAGSGNNYELFAYQTSQLVSGSEYDLSYLVRGAYDSPILSHAASEQFARIDSSIFEYTYTQDKIGTLLYIKLPAFNIYGGGQQSTADVEPFTFALQGLAYSSPLPNVQNLRTSYVANITQLAWDEITDFRPVLYEIRKGASWVGAQVLGRVAHPPFNVQGNGTYWVSAYSQPAPGLHVYSQAPMDIAITGAQIISNVIASWNEGGTGWTGSFGGAAVLSGGDVVLTGAGNILSDPDYLNTADIFDYGGIGGSGTYTIPSGHIINIGRVAPCSVIISSQSFGQHVSDNVLGLTDYLNFQDILDSSAQALVNVYPNIALSQDGVTWGSWQKWTPGSYIAMVYKAQMVLETSDPTVQAVLESFVFEVDVPDRDDHYTNLSVPSSGYNLAFKPDGSSTAAAFNGGPANGNLPAVQVTILNAQAGDQLVLSGLSLSGCTLNVVNGGSGVARSVNVLAEGY